MFPSAKTRFAAAMHRGFDLVVEFATLGEFRLDLVSSEAARAAEHPRSRRPAERPAAAEELVTARLRPTRVRPATAAARRLQPDTPVRRAPSAPRRTQPSAPPLRIAAAAGLRGLAFDACEVRPPRGGRKRAGAARPAPQPCLVAEGRGAT